MVEGYVLLIAACIPTIQPIYDRLNALVMHHMTRSPIAPTAASYALTQYHHHKERKRSTTSFWSALMPSLDGDTRCSVHSLDGSRAIKGRQRTTTVWEEVESQRILGGAGVHLAYPPAAMRRQAVGVGQLSRIRSPVDSF